MLTVASHPMMGETFCLWRMVEVLANAVKVLESKALSHLLATSVASELVDRNRLGNRNMLTLSPVPYDYSV